MIIKKNILLQNCQVDYNIAPSPLPNIANIEKKQQHVKNQNHRWVRV